MKSFLLKISGFFLLLALLFGGIEYAIRLIPNDYNYKADYYRQHAHEIKTWCLGSSHAYYGIDPDQFEAPCFNGAHVSQSINFDWKLFHRYIRQMDSLEVLILPASYFSLFSRLENSAEHWRIVNYTEYQIYTPNIRHLLRIFGDTRAFDRAKDGIRGKANDRTCLDNGMGSLFRYENRYTELDSLAQASANRHRKKLQPAILKQSEKYLHNICQTCQKRQIQVILLSSPVHESYYRLLDSTQLSLTINHYRNLAEKYPHVEYLNWMQHPDFTQEDFFDADHLNHLGAVKLSRYLNDFIEGEKNH